MLILLAIGILFAAWTYGAVSQHDYPHVWPFHWELTRMRLGKFRNRR